MLPYPASCRRGVAADVLCQIIPGPKLARRQQFLSRRSGLQIGFAFVLRDR